MASSTEKTVFTILLVVIVVFILLNFSPFFLCGPHGFLPFHEFNFPTALSLSILPLLLLGVWIVVMVWVFRDAESRGMNGLLWALLIFVGNVIGLIIYLIVRNENEVAATVNRLQNLQGKTITCSNCSNTVAEKYTYCPHCGNNLKTVCPSCAKPTQSEWKVCPYCGEKLKES
jgi:hypothetical protein